MKSMVDNEKGGLESDGNVIAQRDNQERRRWKSKDRYDTKERQLRGQNEGPQVGKE